MGATHEYVPLKEFARRMNMTVRTAREWAHQDRLQEYIRRRQEQKSVIFINWTLFQRDFEEGKI